MSNKGAVPDRIETEEYGDLLEKADENLLKEYPNKEESRKFYSKRFRYWLSWCDDRDDVDPWNPVLNDVQNYVRYLNGEQSSGRKIEHRVRAIRITYDILKQENEVDNNPAEDHFASDFLDDKPINERRVAENKQAGDENYDTIDPSDFEKMLESVPAPQLRNQLILKCLWSLMLRAEQVVQIRKGDIYCDENRMYLRDNKKDVNDRDYRYDVFYKEDFSYLLDRWLDKGREDLAPSMSRSEYLFISHQSEQMNKETITDIVKQSAENAGVQEEMYVDGKGDSRYKITAHTLRRSCATYLANKVDSYPIHMLSDDLNHRSVDTTKEMYVRDDPEERRNKRDDIDIL